VVERYRNAASLGYFKDDYSQYFLKTKKKMFPIINRGTWTRVFAVRQVMERFLKAYSSKVKNGEIETIQIVGLGAGFDTSYFWIRDLVASG
jgi:tRNA wybutosine-synthesizing protein 4